MQEIEGSKKQIQSIPSSTAESDNKQGKSVEQSVAIHRMGTSLNLHRYSSKISSYNMHTRNHYSQRASMLLWALTLFAVELETGEYNFSFSISCLLINDEKKR